MIFKSLYLILLLTLSLQSTKNSLKYILKIPKSETKDYIILEYYKNNKLSLKKANILLNSVKNINKNILYAYSKSVKNRYLNNISKCYKVKTLINYRKLSAHCISIIMNIHNFIKLDSHDKKNVYDIVAKRFGSRHYKIYRYIIEHQNYYGWNTDQANGNYYLSVFKKSRNLYRKKHFNHSLSKRQLKKLSTNPNFNFMIYKVAILNDKLPLLQNSLLKLDSNLSSNRLNSESYLYLALIALKKNKNRLAKKFIKKALSSAKSIDNKDKYNFWLYLITKKDIYLNNILKNRGINIYKIYASEIKNRPLSKKIIFLKLKQKSKNYGMYKHMQMETESKYIKKIYDINKYKNEKLGHIYMRLLNRKNKYKNIYFITPYKKYLKDLNFKEKSFLYSIMRQESLYYKYAVSQVYALGMMQIMPFLVSSISKKLNCKINLSKDMFIPKLNIKFAKYHIYKFLKPNLNNNILYMAYAYSAGLSFTKNFVKNNFKKDRKYEPFYSLEMVPVRETKKYGKQVLVSYYIYMNHYKKGSFKLKKFFNSLMN